MAYQATNAFFTRRFIRRHESPCFKGKNIYNYERSLCKWRAINTQYLARSFQISFKCLFLKLVQFYISIIKIRKELKVF
jgi:hypothetical protein